MNAIAWIGVGWILGWVTAVAVAELIWKRKRLPSIATIIDWKAMREDEEQGRMWPGEKP